MPVDQFGQPLPWYTYPFISFIEKRASSDLAVFEFGMGNSTRWWSRLMSDVTACEHDRAWFEAIKSTLPSRVKVILHTVESENYVNAANEFGKAYDLIVVDGRRRVDCIRNSVSALSESGVLILDNSERERYRGGHEYLRSLGFGSIEFWGMSPTSVKETCTTLYYRSGNCLNL